MGFSLKIVWSTLLLSAPASAVTRGFDCLTGNLAGDCAIGESQLSVELNDQGGGVVQFHSRNASPPNLPSGQNAIPPFQVTSGFLAESVPAPSMNGVGPAEWVKIQFTLQGGQTINDVLTELTNGDLRIGIHVIAFESGGSESFINTPIPEPATALLVGLGLLGLAARRGKTS